MPGSCSRDLAFGLFWGLFVFTIDRWLVSSVHYEPLDGGNDGRDPGGRAKKYVGAFGALVMAASCRAWTRSRAGASPGRIC